jgi:hypothetical protein
MNPSEYHRLDSCLHGLMAWLKRWTPGPFWQAARRLGTAIAWPALASYTSGHFRSALQARAVNAHGRPIPWYTYPATAALAGADYRERRVLEWGGGQSTLWWAARAEQVVTFEADLAWYSELRTRRPENVVLRYLPGGQPSPDLLDPDERFDIVVVDGCNRFACARWSIDRLSPNGALILDNAEGYWGPEPGRYPILELLRDQGFQRVDFFGYAPGVTRPHCTSIFFRTACFLFSGQRPPDIRRATDFAPL